MSKFDDMSFNEKLDFFSHGSVGVKKYYPTMDTVAYLPVVSGRNVKLTDTVHESKESALSEAIEYRKQCTEYPRKVA